MNDDAVCVDRPVRAGCRCHLRIFHVAVNNGERRKDSQSRDLDVTRKEALVVVTGRRDARVCALPCRGIRGVSSVSPIRAKSAFSHVGQQVTVSLNAPSQAEV